MLIKIKWRTFGNILNALNVGLFFHLIEMSVLEEEECGVSELLRCKLNYLQAENSWMQTEYGFLCKLIDLQKQIIHGEPDTTSALSQTITQILADRQKHIEAVQRKSQTVNCDLQVEEFIPFIYSFEEKIEKLQNQIKKRQAALQQIELAKLSEGQEQRRPEFKCINAYQSHSRILDRIKKEISGLQAKKQRLQNDLLTLNDGEESTVASQVQSRSKVGSELTIGTSQDDQSSIFERVIMLIKKKRYQNGCLEEKVGRLKRGIEHKRTAANQLRKEIQGMEWNCLDGLVGAGGFVDGPEASDLSMAGRSFTNNTSFSFDVSRFIRPKRNLRMPEN